MSDGIELMNHQDEDGELVVRQTWDGSHVALDIRENGQEPVTVSMPSAWLYAIWEMGQWRGNFVFCSKGGNSTARATKWKQKANPHASCNV